MLHAVTQGEEGGDEKFGITEVGVEVIGEKAMSNLTPQQ